MRAAGGSWASRARARPGERSRRRPSPMPRAKITTMAQIGARRFRRRRFRRDMGHLRPTGLRFSDSPYCILSGLFVLCKTDVSSDSSLCDRSSLPEAPSHQGKNVIRHVIALTRPGSRLPKGAYVWLGVWCCSLMITDENQAIRLPVFSDSSQAKSTSQVR